MKKNILGTYMQVYLLDPLKLHSQCLSEIEVSRGLESPYPKTSSWDIWKWCHIPDRPQDILALGTSTAREQQRAWELMCGSPAIKPLVQEQGELGSLKGFHLLTDGMTKVVKILAFFWSWNGRLKKAKYSKGAQLEMTILSKKPNRGSTSSCQHCLYSKSLSRTDIVRDCKNIHKILSRCIAREHCFEYKGKYMGKIHVKILSRERLLYHQ